MIAGWLSLFLYNGGLASVVAVAQLVESQIVILVVVGSSPIGHPTEPLPPQHSKRLFNHPAVDCS